MAKRTDLHMNGQYQREPWGYAGMEARIYRPIAKEPARMTRLYAMRSLRGVIATARTMDALADLAQLLGSNVPARHEGRARGLGFGSGIGEADENAQGRRRT